jgi:hypothetical protein
LFKVQAAQDRTVVLGFLWHENDSNGNRTRRTAVIGTVEQLPTRDQAEVAVNGLRVCINQHRNRQREHSIVVADFALKSSAGKQQRGPISKQRNRWLQTTLVEGAKLAPRWNPQLAALHARELERGHRNRATLAVARKLVAYLLAVDKSRRSFQVRAPSEVPTQNCTLSLRARDLDAVGASGIPRNALVQRFGDLFTVAIAAQLLLVGGTADERNFRQDPWHRAFRQHHEAGFPDAAVAQTGILRRQCPVQRALHTLRQPSRLFNPLPQASRRK